jgi:hypothetical protein
MGLNKEKRLKYMRNWRNDNREKVREQRRKYHRKGLPVPTHSMPEVCEICGNPPSGRLTVLCVDHCHTTKKFRGWLCNNCNIGLGNFKDNQMTLSNAIRYLNGEHLK